MGCLLPVFVLPNGLKQLLLLWAGLAPPTSFLLSTTPCQLQAGQQEHDQDPCGLPSFLDVKGFIPSRSLSLITKTEAQTS